MLSDNAQALALLRAQHGVAGRFQLIRLVSDDAVDALVQRGSLEPVERGVYAVAGSATTPEQAAMAALLRARPAARLTGPFVLGLLGLEGVSRFDPFTVLTAPGRRLRGVAFDHRPDPVGDRTPTMVGPLACVHPQVAWLDSLALVPERTGRVLLHLLRRRGHWTDERLDRELAARGGKAPEVVLARRLLEAGELASESAEETEMVRRLRAIEPSLETQVWVTPRHRLDAYVRRVRLGFEYQGTVDHAHLDGRLLDAEKAAAAESVGVRIVPVVAADLRSPEFDDWVRGLLATRAFELRQLAR